MNFHLGINFRGFHGFSANLRNVLSVYLSPSKISSRKIFKTLTKVQNVIKKKFTKNCFIRKTLFSRNVFVSCISHPLFPRNFNPNYDITDTRLYKKLSTTIYVIHPFFYKNTVYKNTDAETWYHFFLSENGKYSPITKERCVK